MKIILSALAAALLVASFGVQEAHAFRRGYSDTVAAWHASRMPWHGPYFHVAHGRPVPLVVPPTANMQTSYSWGVAQTEMRPIYHQFSRPFPGATFGPAAPMLPTPPWPSHTDQFGVYYIRGPW